mmetsp:Transcript_66274/g.138406  ORF Transcript_66274/g.138406 Transcript_66274/m.138406 type:complete len:534 (+) Transcript_66274:42-1643(+)
MSDEAPQKGFLATLGQSLCCAICVAPVAVLGAIALTAHNERSSVCVMHALDDGYEAVETVPCSPAKHSTSEDDLFLFRCPLDKDHSRFGPAWHGYDDFDLFGPLHFDGIGLEVEVQMYQCIETIHKSNTSTTYTYAKAFKSVPAPEMVGPQWDYYCGDENPSWPSGLPSFASARAPSVKAGAYELSENMISSIALNTPVDPISTQHSSSGPGFNWQKASHLGAGVYITNDDRVPRRLDRDDFGNQGNGNIHGNGNPTGNPGQGNIHGNGNGFGNNNPGQGNIHGNVNPGQGNIHGNGNPGQGQGNIHGNGFGNNNNPGQGNIRGNGNGFGHGNQPFPNQPLPNEVPGQYPLGTLKASFNSNSWEDVAVLGHERNGKMENWEAPDAWMCSGYGLETLRQTTTRLDKESMFSTLHGENKVWTIILRVLAFCIFWGAFAAMVEPLGVVADFMPIIGGCLGDAFDVIQCCISCLPATACFCTVAGVMYVVMRPAVGAPMLLGTAAIVGFMVYAKVSRKSKESGEGGEAAALIRAEGE